MQPKPTSTHRKSNYAKQRGTLQQKATTGKQKNNSTVTINLEEKWLDKQEVLQRLHISDSPLLKWRRQACFPTHLLWVNFITRNQTCRNYCITATVQTGHELTLLHRNVS